MPWTTLVPAARAWDGWRRPFLSFLPVCFVFMVTAPSDTAEEEVRRLRQELVELKRT